MGVTGLWRLIEPAGKPVPVETLENKVLAVDISIWLHQVVKGYQDAKGAPLPNAHLMGLFQRLCKLLYFRIKPVFVFDGAFPELKKETIAKRHDSKAKYNSQSEKLKREIALLLGKKTAISALLGKQISPKKNKQQDNDDLFKLPALPEKETESESESEDETNSSASTVDLHSVDLDSEKFKNMPLKDKYDLLVELKETRKMNSWGKIHTLPKKSDNFSNFQMERLLKRRKLQECLEETEKEMGDGGMSLTELESLLNEEGIDTKIDSLPAKRIASNNTTRYLLITNVKQALEDAKKKEIAAAKAKEQPETSTNQEKSSSNRDELEDDLQKAIKMSLECVDDADTSAGASKTDDSWTSVLTDTDYSDDEDDDGFQHPDMSSAKAYIMQYSDFTHQAIDNIVVSKQKIKNKSKEPKIDEIIEELNQEKTIIEDNIELSSSDEDTVQKSASEMHPKAVFEENQYRVSEHNITHKTENRELVTHNETDSLNMNDTQQSVVCIENVSDEVISLETSLEEYEDQDTKLDQPNSKVDVESESNDSLLDQPGPKVDRQSKSSDTPLEQSKPKVNLKPEFRDTLFEQPKPNVNLESDSSDDEFEEVSDDEEKRQKVAIQLNLKMGEKVEDDIFADIFENDVNKAVDKISNIHDNNPIKTELYPFHMQKSVDINLKNNISKTQEIQPNEKTVEETQNRVTVSNQDISSNKKTDEVPDIPNVKSSNKKTNEVPVISNVNLQTKNYDIEIPSESTPKETITEIGEKPNRKVMTIEKLNSLASQIENEEEDLLQEKGRLDRIGRNITEQMTKEAQELLRVFGIPYIVAPMEAEAQCAFLENANLTDGTITDDSDIWLFGGKTVYKNFFNQKKHVLQFLSERIEKSFNLSREQLVLLALLVGSDYTTGVMGVGPVTALEILASFPFNKKKLTSDQPKQTQYQELIAGLMEFKKWVRAGKRTDNISLKKKLKNVSLTDDFPSVRVVQAYLEPNVERSEEKFTWGEIDITILRDYTKSKFGWSQNKLDEIIKPVLKRMLDRKNQKTVYDYFKRKLEFQSLEDQMSKRVKAAVRKMGPEESGTNVNDESDINNDKQKTKRKRKPKTNHDVEAGPSKSKQLKSTKQEDEIRNIDQVVKSTVVIDSDKIFDVSIKKTERYQEIIPQREMDKKHLLESKLKAIEVFRKTKIDRKTKKTKRKLPVPKDKADLSESDSN